MELRGMSGSLAIRGGQRFSPLVDQGPSSMMSGAFTQGSTQAMVYGRVLRPSQWGVQSMRRRSRRMMVVRTMSPKAVSPSSMNRLTQRMKVVMEVALGVEELIQIATEVVNLEGEAKRSRSQR